MHHQLEAEIGKYFSARHVAGLVSKHHESYGRAALHYSPEDGWDAQMFGFAVYKYTVKRLRDLVAHPELGFELRPTNMAFRIGLGPFTLAPYRCGQSADEDINESFPSNENGALTLAEANQLALDLHYSEPVIPRAMVLAHFGNPLTGLEALYLAVPSSMSDTRIDGWGYTRLLWRRDAGEERPQGSIDLPRPAPIAPAPLSLKIDIAKTAGDVGSA
jgi:hypothetical protein